QEGTPLQRGARGVFCPRLRRPGRVPGAGAPLRAQQPSAAGARNRLSGSGRKNEPFSVLLPGPRPPGPGVATALPGVRIYLYESSIGDENRLITGTARAGV